MLFKPDDSSFSNNEAAEFDASEAIKEAYETVNEGDTTDTTSGMDTEGLLASRRTDKAADQEQTAATRTSASGSKIEEGIKSSSSSSSSSSSESDEEHAKVGRSEA